MVTMSNPSTPLLRFMILLSLSLSAVKPYAFLPPRSSSPPPKATGTDLLAVLGPPSQASSVNPTIAAELRSCLRFLVPFSQDRRESETERCSLHDYLRLGREGDVQEDNQLVWCPPEPVLELARLAVDSSVDPDSIYRTLDPTVIPVPDVEGSKEHRCELTRTPYGRRFISDELNSYFEYLFKLIVSRGPEVGLTVSLSRFDLFHGHLFLSQQTGRLGILFHAKEYPAYDNELFPYNMGYCQIGSEVTYDDSMNLRNILWLAPMPSNSTRDWLAPGVLVVLDAHPDGIIYKDLIPEYVQFVRTIYEEVLGNTAVDINYLNVGNPKPNLQLFVC